MMRMTRRTLFAAAASTAVVGCAAKPPPGAAPAGKGPKPAGPAGSAGVDGAAGGALAAFTSRAAALVEPSARFAERARGYRWAEGPAWDRRVGALYFTDVPANKAYRWTEASGAETFLDPSGLAGDTTGFREPGANGLALSASGDLLICNHGTRRVERMDLTTMVRTPIATAYDGEPFNSPNDLIEAPDGAVYFTDPPYGLEGLDASPLKRQEANGVYRVSLDGEVTRLVSDMTRPNGIALSPDSSRLYVSNSDPALPIIRELTIVGGAVSADRVLADFSAFQGEDAPGLPDGMAVAADGVVFATGPGGIFLVTPDGEVAGRLSTGRPTANCAFGGEDGGTLFAAAQDRLLSIPTRTRGLAWG